MTVSSVGSSSQMQQLRQLQQSQLQSMFQTADADGDGKGLKPMLTITFNALDIIQEEHTDSAGIHLFALLACSVHQVLV